MALMAPREKWTDDRLDDLNKRVDVGFARVEGDIRELRDEVKQQGESLRAEMSTGFKKAEASLEKAQESFEKSVKGTKVELEKKIDDGIGRLERDNSSLKRVVYVAAATVILSQIAGISPL